MASPYLSLLGKRTARNAYGGAGKGCRRKRKPCCNGADRDSGSVPTRKGADFRQVPDHGKPVARPLKPGKQMICAKPQSAPGALIGKVIRGGIVKVRKKFRTASERPNRALQEPEPPALKGARAVLRGRGCGNTPLLPDFFTDYWCTQYLQSAIAIN